MQSSTTSYIERFNLTLKHYKRRSNAHSKSVVQHDRMLDIFIMYYTNQYHSENITWSHNERNLICIRNRFTLRFNDATVYPLNRGNQVFGRGSLWRKTRHGKVPRALVIHSITGHLNCELKKSILVRGNDRQPRAAG